MLLPFVFAWDKQIRDAQYSEDSLAEGPHCHLWKILQTLARVKPGMIVVVTEVGVWSMGDVIYKERGARDPKVPTLFQIACVDTGVIRWVNADQVTQVMLPGATDYTLSPWRWFSIRT